MILSFKPQFKEPILTGTKIHTIRTDVPGRWKKGNHIHFATGVRTKNYECFKEGVCTGVGIIDITRNPIMSTVRINGFLLEDFQVEALALNDGFESEYEFWQWFKDDFHGKIIHWTDLRY